MIYVSCAPSNMYRNGAWYDDPVLLNEFTNGAVARHAPDTVAEIFPPYQYDRGTPSLLGGGETELGQVAAVAQGTLRDFQAGPASTLMRAADCCVSRSVIYLLRDAETFVVYETHRPNDRSMLFLRNDNEIRLVDEYKRFDPFVAYLWIGSGGSMNYGHWLVDDLPRVAAVVELRRLRPYAKIVIVTPACGAQHDLLHAQSAGAIAAVLEIENIELLTVERDSRIFFQELYFVTPVTHHPVLKSPEAMRFVADLLPEALNPAAGTSNADDRLPRRLFVRRAWTGARDLANQDEIADLLAGHGFLSVETSDMPVLEQAKLFSGAEMVIGCMGASMTNTVFCPEGAAVGQISPQGWIETFYWDLAATRRHRYVACYGLSTPQEGPAWRKNFRANPADVLRMLAMLTGDAVEANAAAGPSRRDPADLFNPFAT